MGGWKLSSFDRCLDVTKVFDLQVVEQHLMCAAIEYPLHIEHDEIFLGSGTQSAIMKLVKEGLLGRHPTNGPQDKSWHYIGHEVHIPHT